MGRKHLSRKSTLTFLCLVTFGLVGYHLIPFGFNHQSFPRGLNLLGASEAWNETSLNPEQACQFPSHNPFDPSILSYVTASRPINCKWRQEPLTMLDSDGILRFNDTALARLGYSTNSLNCYYQKLKRLDGQDDVSVYEPMSIMTGHDFIDVDCIRTFCHNWIGVNIYENIHVNPRFLFPPRLQREPGDDNHLSIAIFGVDSMSRLNFLRHLPSTYLYLTQNMKATVLRGLVKVGDNTYPNMAAVLTGRKTYTEELKYLAMGEYYDDLWPLIWKNFSRAGYLTLLAEDLPEFTLFNHLTSGFYKQPTDYYLRPFWVAVEQSKTHSMSSNLCFGNTPKHLLHIEYVHRFLKRYSQTPYFAFSFLTEISHDYMNQVGEADIDFEQFLRDLHEGGHFNNTLLIFMGDHGHRFDSIRTTTIGRTEESMPFAAIYLPPWIKEKFPRAIENLEKNVFRLTSMFDFYDTIVDIFHYATRSIPLGSHPQPHLFRGYSLFTEIPINRTCTDAGIPQQFCVCDREETLSTDEPIVNLATGKLMQELNSITERFRNICSILYLQKIHGAQEIVPYNAKPIVDHRRIRLTIEVTPGSGLFEAILDINNDTKFVQLLFSISRINRYKGQDWCLNNSMDIKKVDLRKYCYCSS